MTSFSLYTLSREGNCQKGHVCLEDNCPGVQQDAKARVTGLTAKVTVTVTKLQANAIIIYRPNAREGISIAQR